VTGHFEPRDGVVADVGVRQIGRGETGQCSYPRHQRVVYPSASHYIGVSQVHQISDAFDCSLHICSRHFPQNEGFKCAHLPDFIASEIAVSAAFEHEFFEKFKIFAHDGQRVVSEFAAVVEVDCLKGEFVSDDEVLEVGWLQFDFQEGDAQQAGQLAQQVPGSYIKSLNLAVIVHSSECEIADGSLP
jgi:hypothetical protein